MINIKYHIIHRKVILSFLIIPGNSSEEVFQYLLEKGYIVRAFPNGIRITIGTEQENEELFRAIVEGNHLVKQLERLGSEKMREKETCFINWGRSNWRFGSSCD